MMFELFRMVSENFNVQGRVRIHLAQDCFRLALFLRSGYVQYLQDMHASGIRTLQRLMRMT